MRLQPGGRSQVLVAYSPRQRVTYYNKTDASVDNLTISRLENDLKAASVTLEAEPMPNVD